MIGLIIIACGVGWVWQYVELAYKKVGIFLISIGLTYQSAAIIFTIFVLSLIVIRLVYKYIDKNSEVKKVSDITKICLKKIEQFDSSLSVRYYQTIYKDVYGNDIKDKWEKEKKYFIEKNLYSFLLEIPSGDSRAKAVEQCWKHIDTVAMKSINAKAGANVASSVHQLNKGMTPNDYERFCAELLRKSGWEAHVTKVSNDQGCDIVATKNGHKLVVQCKLYSSPVGNSAVQEISASRLHEQADFAAVVSNATFTRPARQLANTNNVMLLHHDQLLDLEKEIAALSTQTV